jgi:hypothetical protein
MGPFNSFPVDIARQQAVQEIAEELGLYDVQVHPLALLRFGRRWVRRLTGFMRLRTTEIYPNKTENVPARLLRRDSSR